MDRIYPRNEGVGREEANNERFLWGITLITRPIQRRENAKYEWLVRHERAPLQTREDNVETGKTAATWAGGLRRRNKSAE